MTLVTCNRCRLVMFEVTLEQAVKEVQTFNEMFDQLSLEKQLMIYGGHKATIENYKKCLGCQGSYKYFKDAKEGDAPDGVTINPILRRDQSEPKSQVMMVAKFLGLSCLVLIVMLLMSAVALIILKVIFDDTSGFGLLLICFALSMVFTWIFFYAKDSSPK